MKPNHAHVLEGCACKSSPSTDITAVNFDNLLAAVPRAFSYDADDRLVLDAYDVNGNTISSGGIANSYDFENHLSGQGGAAVIYDGEGNRVKKTVAGVAATYNAADENPTGYAQVVGETIGGRGRIAMHAPMRMAGAHQPDAEILQRAEFDAD